MSHEAHFQMIDAALLHPDGRARGGESCVVCGSPVPANAHWKQRDRHVCSGRCNHNLVRRFNSGSALVSVNHAQVDALAQELAALSNPRSGGPRLFGTVASPEPGELPIQWEGYGPLPGDVVERYGVQTVHLVQDMPDTYYTNRVIAAIAVGAPEEMYVTGADSDGFPTMLTIGPYRRGEQVRHGVFGHEFEVEGVRCHWRRELITDLHPDGINHFRWECYAAVPVDAPAYPDPMHSPLYRAEMNRRRRVSSNTTRHGRRALETAVIEDFDPREIFDRDLWMCQICGSEVDREVLYPDLMSASLDHVIPLSKGGNHTRSNSVLAHLRCNLRKSSK